MKNFFENARNILIIQLGDIGDIVWTTPALWAVKRTYPEANISILLREGMGTLVESDPYVHRIFEVLKVRGNPLKGFFRQLELIVQLRRQRFNVAIDLRSDERGSYMAFVSGAPVRISQFYRDASLLRKMLFTHTINAPYDLNARGAAEQSLKLFRQIGITTGETKPKLWISERNRKRAVEILREEGITGETRWVSVNPFSRWTYKEWDNDKWAAVIDWLWNQYKIATALVGDARERDKAGRLAEKSKAKAYNLAGKTSLDELAAVLQLSLLNIGVDSAAPHIAAAVGTPTVTIYGPSDWKDWAPVGEKHSVVVPELDCVPCYQKGCEGKGWSRCLDELTVEKVKEEIREALDKINQRFDKRGAQN